MIKSRSSPDSKYVMHLIMPYFRLCFNWYFLFHFLSYMHRLHGNVVKRYVAHIFSQWFKSVVKSSSFDSLLHQSQFYRCFILLAIVSRDKSTEYLYNETIGSNKRKQTHIHIFTNAVKHLLDIYIRLIL